METLIRRPAVAGRFYPGDPESLRDEARASLSPPLFPNDKSSADEWSEPLIRAIGCIAPHAGYMYSGHVAGAVFARIEIPQRCFGRCPNHTGVGRALGGMV